LLLGYSFKTSQYGLTVDNIVRFELVLPNGTITNVTSKDEDLWFGLRVSREARYILVWLRASNFREG
jgi:FAD/FMN-containing dehydrogenase